MFCMNCGQQLPDGAKFCLNCGTPQGAVSPTGNSNSNTINLDGTHTFVPAVCPKCNAHMNVNIKDKTARCDACGTECLIQDAIKALTIKGNVHVGKATFNVNGANVASLLKRVEIMLADGDFKGAMDKCDVILDSEPTNAQAYIGKLMAAHKVHRQEQLADLNYSFKNDVFYQNAYRFGDESTKATLAGYLRKIEERNNSERLKRLYDDALLTMHTARGSVGYEFAAGRFDKIIEYKDSRKLKEKCLIRAKDLKEEEEKLRIQKEIEDKKIKELQEKRQEEIQKNPKKNDIIYFGSINGLKMWWRVLDVEKNKALIISNDVVAGLSYHDSYLRKTKWDNCNLREWLNTYFYNNYFTSAERARIVQNKTVNKSNPNYNTPGCKTTLDNVFLLSCDEVNQYFTHYTNEPLNNMRTWWLRTPGQGEGFAAYVLEVNSEMNIDYGGYFCTNVCGVRPVMWIKLG